MSYIRFFDSINMNDVDSVGGKNASLGEMISQLSSAGVKVPFGFATTSEAYWKFLEEEGLKEKIQELFIDLDINNISSLQRKSLSVRQLILNTPLPFEIEKEIHKAYKKLSAMYKQNTVDVAVRSSATAEDLPDASFAGQQETFLNVKGAKELSKKIHECYASLYTDRAVSYRHSRGYSHFSVALCVGVQKMVRSDKASSGVMFSIDTESGSDNLIMINSSWGLGENIVGGVVNPDEFYVFKPMLKKGVETILKHQLGSKKKTMVYDEVSGVRNLDTNHKDREKFSLNDTDIISLAKYALKIEEHYTKISGHNRPMDIEWAKDGISGELFIVQARPETVQSRKNAFAQSIYRLQVGQKNIKTILSGQAVGERIGVGNVRIINSVNEFHLFKEGEVLVTKMTDPDWEPLMKKASAIVTNCGGRTCHAAIIAREIGVPAVVGCNTATSVLKDAQPVTISCAEGEQGLIFEGLLPFDIEEMDLSSLQTPNTKIYMNVADPKKAFSLAKLPNQGVGLARMEFIINSEIKAHPMALYDLDRGVKVKDEEQISVLAKGYDSYKEFFVNHLSEGIGMIAAAFYPKPVIVRTSDFKSNEYKHMLGGEDYEKDEENPMIGFRGASRYYAPEYRPAFEWECEALKRVRDTMGLSNVKLMLPFVRTPQEGKKVINIMNEKGLVQGKNGLKIYAMCEIPANVIIADKFLEIFDGYSIGSNDLTQLTLGVDRDSALISHLFDERNEALKKMIQMAIQACKKAHKYIGICGQAPSDYPEITRFLVQEGIDSISLNPDSLYKMWKTVVELESSTTESVQRKRAV